MAITQNTFTGNGSNLGPFSFTFQWLESTDIKVTVAGVLKTAGTHYNLQSLNYATKTGGQVLFTAGNAPANGAAIVIYRQTDDTDLVSTFYSGSAIRAQDLNNNFTQGLYVTQEANNNVTTANANASTALTTANTALSNSTAAQSSAATAISTANAASASASSAVSTANAASAAAASAVSTANTANTNATAALNAAAEALAYTIVANVAAIPASPVKVSHLSVVFLLGLLVMLV
jgi:cobalamin biosynthesis Mg chelatase CobN